MLDNQKGDGAICRDGELRRRARVWGRTELGHADDKGSGRHAGRVRCPMSGKYGTLGQKRGSRLRL